MQRMMFSTAGILGVFLAILGTGANSRSTTADTKNNSAVKVKVYDFSTGTDADSNREAMKIVDTHQRTAIELMDQLQHKHLPPQRRIHVIYALGMLRARGAIDSLIDCVDLQNPEYANLGMTRKVIRGGIPRWGEYPAEDALRNIGYPAVYRILQRLPKERSDQRLTAKRIELRRRLLCRVVSDVAGADFSRKFLARRMRVSTRRQILTQRRSDVKTEVEALKQARGGKQPQGGELPFNDPRYGAIQILAEFRASEGVNELLRIVDLKTQVRIISENRPTTHGDYYPAAGALAEIGNPAVRPAVWELTKEATARRRENLCWVIGEIEGAKVGRWRIEEQIAELQQQAKAAKAKGRESGVQIPQIERLRAAIPILEKLFPLK